LKESMAFHRDLICFRHCGKSIFVYDNVSMCPLCKEALSSRLDSIPFTLPYPFVKAQQYPCSVVLRPSHGDFLSSFDNQRNLHIGLTSSIGSIFEYDVNGLIHTSAKTVGINDWNQCILVAQVTSSWYDRWDAVLNEFLKNDAWKKEFYQEQSHNCYTFVLNFLKSLDHYELSRYCHDKISFSEMFLVPKTQNAAKYITIHRGLNSCSYWVEEQK
uniref:Uncharacterized protein n=1 Tax=Anopheles atroparvus TaxID=41427 RepID=A0A182IQW2_ANOAO